MALTGGRQFVLWIFFLAKTDSANELVFIGDVVGVLVILHRFSLRLKRVESENIALLIQIEREISGRV